MGAQEMLLFLGKGGVGKSTLAAASALRLAESGNRVRLLSLDPAHNLADIFGCRGPRFKPDRAIPLEVEEVNPAVWTKKYLREIRDQARARFRYWTTLGLDLDGMVDMLADSPGVEEYALLRALSVALQKTREGSVLVVDTPPTALALRILTLAATVTRWADKLSVLRSRILRERFSIKRLAEGGRIPIAGFTEEDDPVSGRLNDLHAEYSGLDRFLCSEACRIFVVTTPGLLARQEAGRICTALGDAGVAPTGIVINRSRREPDEAGGLPSVPRFCIPEGDAPAGLDGLRLLPVDFVKRGGI